MKESTFLKIQTVWPLVLGGALYFVLSPDVWAVKAVVHVFHLEYPPAPSEAVMGIPVLRFIRNYGLDMLWGYALASAIFLIVRQEKENLTDREVLVITFAFSAFLEFLQLLPWISGTFDALDIAAMWAAQILGCRVARHAADRRGENKYEKMDGKSSARGGACRLRGNGSRERFFRQRDGKQGR